MQESQTKSTPKKNLEYCFVLFCFVFETEATTTTQNSQSLTSKRPDLPQSSLLLENCSGKMTETNA
jgi:hypothetical protein